MELAKCLRVFGSGVIFLFILPACGKSSPAPAPSYAGTYGGNYNGLEEISSQAGSVAKAVGGQLTLSLSDTGAVTGTSDFGPISGSWSGDGLTFQATATGSSCNSLSFTGTLQSTNPLKASGGWSCDKASGVWSSNKQ